MYMYYFLGYQLKGNSSLKTDEEKPQHILYLYLYLYLIGDSSLKTEEEKRQRANNTFLLALDGDVDFQPDAIVKVLPKRLKRKSFSHFYSQVVDLMKRNPRIGAACGRIHPTGSGLETHDKDENELAMLWKIPTNWDITQFYVQGDAAVPKV